MSVTVAELIAAAQARKAPLAAESAGYVVLAAADQVSAAPRRVSAPTVELTDEGGIRLCGGEPCNEADAERELRALLDRLQLVSSSLTPALFRVAHRAESVGLAAFVRELESALIPVNRGAARRALARLSRETTRALSNGLVQSPATALPKVAERVVETPAPALAPPPEAREALEAKPAREPETDKPGETRPEPLARRLVPKAEESPEPSLPAFLLSAMAAPDADARTPMLGTLLAPASLAEAPAEPDFGDLGEELMELDELTDPMTFAEEGEEFDVTFEPEPEPEPDHADSAAPATTLSAVVETLPQVFEIRVSSELPIEELRTPLPELAASSDVSEQAEAIELGFSNAFGDSELGSSVDAIELEPGLQSLGAPELEADDAESSFQEDDQALELGPSEPAPAVEHFKLPREPRRSELGDLLRSFGNECGPSEPEVRRELKKLAGLEPTPPPPGSADSG
jgi:hypothetical protein